MSTNLNFRSALNGFNREDVVNYIEFLTNRHVSDLSQMKAQLDAANEEIERLKTQPAPAEDTEALSQAKARITELEAQVATLNGREPALSENAQAELEAYRRAERAERAARQRAAQLCSQANAILADATAKVEEAGSGWRRPWAASAPSSALCRLPFSRARALCGMRLRSFTP